MTDEAEPDAIPTATKAATPDVSAGIELALASLDARAAAVFRARHPWDGTAPVPPKQVAEEHGISPSRVSQIDTAAGAALRGGPHVEFIRDLLRSRSDAVAEVAVRDSRSGRISGNADARLLAVDPVAAFAMKVVHNSDYDAWEADYHAWEAERRKETDGSVPETKSEADDGIPDEAVARAAETAPEPLREPSPDAPETNTTAPEPTRSEPDVVPAPAKAVDAPGGSRPFVDALRRETVLDVGLEEKGPWRAGSVQGLVAASTLLDLLERRSSTLVGLSVLPGMDLAALAAAVDAADARIDAVRRNLLPGSLGSDDAAPVASSDGPWDAGIGAWFGRDGLPSDVRRAAREAVAALGGTRGSVFSARHPLDASDPEPVEAIGARLGLTNGAVSQADAFAGRRLREGETGRLFRRILLDAHSAVARASAEAGPLRVSPGMAERILRRYDPMAAVALRVVYEGDLQAWRRDHMAPDPRNDVDHGPDPFEEPSKQSVGETVAQARIREVLELGPGVPVPADILRDRIGTGIPKQALVDALRTSLPDELPDGYLVPVVPSEDDLLAARLHSCADAAPFPFHPWDLAVLHGRRFGTEVPVRRVVETLESRPHLFVRLHDEAWFAVVSHPLRGSDVPVPRTGLRDADLAEDPVLVELARHLLAEGPDTMQGVLRHARRISGRVGGDVEPKIRTSPIFERYGPVLVGVAGASDDCTSFGSVDEEACANYALARRSGAPKGWYRQWTSEYERRLCTWADRGAPSVLPDLLAACDPTSWPAEPAERRTWVDRKAAEAAWTRTVTRKAPPMRFPTNPHRLVAGLAQAVAGGSIGWMQARRIVGLGSMTCAGTGLLALMVAIGALVPPDDWLDPHLPTTEAPAILAALLGELGWAGRLTWDAGIPADLLAEAAGATRAGGWTTRTEIDDLLALHGVGADA